MSFKTAKSRKHFFANLFHKNTAQAQASSSSSYREKLAGIDKRERAAAIEAQRLENQLRKEHLMELQEQRLERAQARQAVIDDRQREKEYEESRLGRIESKLEEVQKKPEYRKYVKGFKKFIGGF